MKKFVCNGTKDKSNMPLDIEKDKRGKKRKKERRMEGHTLQSEAYDNYLAGQS